MRINMAAVISVTAAFSLVPFVLTAYSGGPPNRRTGAPGDRTCLDSNCHVGVRLDQSTALTLDAPPVYQPGSPARRWTIRIADPAARVYGMQLTTRAATSLATAAGGELRALEDLTSVICDNELFKGPAGCPPDKPVEFFHHTDPRRAGSFAVQWTPPATPVDVAVYLIANASVSGQRNSRIHLRSFVLRPEGGGSVVNAASLQEGISAGAWFSIFGPDLDSPGQLRVEVNGRPATVSYTGATQINALAPLDDPAEGPVEVKILRDGVTRVTRLALKQRWSPALFATAFAEARPGDRLRLYGTGFAPEAAVRFGDRELPARVTASTEPGVQEIDFIVPDLAPGSYPVSATSGGFATNSLRLAIAQP